MKTIWERGDNEIKVVAAMREDAPLTAAEFRSAYEAWRAVASGWDVLAADRAEALFKNLAEDHYEQIARALEELERRNTSEDLAANVKRFSYDANRGWAERYPKKPKNG